MVATADVASTFVAAQATKPQPVPESEVAAPKHEISHQTTEDPALQTESATRTVPSSGQSTLTPYVTGDAADHSDVELYKPYDNGYHFPPRYTAKENWKHGALGFWNYFTTPVGFLVVIYALNIVAWGAMIFFLLLNAAPAMCYPSCDDIDSPRRKWVEYTSQILTALFSVTGFGLAPWRFRDMFWLLKWQITNNHEALRRLAGIHKNWFRLPGSQDIPVDVGPDNLPADLSRDVIPFPENKTPQPPLTGVRAPSTPFWKLNLVLWMNVSNTFGQAALSGIMWGMNRYDRPSWTTGFLVAIAAIVGAVGGLGEFFYGKTVKSIEGVPLTDQDKERLAMDREKGIYHYNNIKGKKPKKEKGDDEEKATKTKSGRSEKK